MIHCFLFIFSFRFIVYGQVRHIGHEIRTPLNVVGVGVDMLIKELKPYAATLPDGVMETIEGIQVGNSHTNILILLVFVWTYLTSFITS